MENYFEQSHEYDLGTAVPNMSKDSLLPDKKIKVVQEKNASRAIYSHLKPAYSFRKFAPVIHPDASKNYFDTSRENSLLTNNEPGTTQHIVEDSKATAKGLDSLLGTKTQIKDKSDENITVRDSKHTGLSPGKMASDSVNEDLGSSPSNPSFNPGIKKFDSQQVLQPIGSIPNNAQVKNSAFLATPAVQRAYNSNQQSHQFK